MKKRAIGQLRAVALVKRLLLVAAAVAAAYGGYLYYMTSRPALPETGAEYRAGQYLAALQAGDYATAYRLASSAAQSETSPAQMGGICREIYSSIDWWQFEQPKYRFTHRSASVPVTLYYGSAWAPQDVATMRGNLDFKLEDGEWRLVVAVPFATAIMKQRDEQRAGG